MSDLDTEAIVLAKMPHTSLTKIRGDGDYVQLYKLRKEAYQNLSAIPCPYGKEGDGHLGLAMPPAQYLMRTGQAFIVPDNPGAYDDDIGNNSGAIARARGEAKHKEAVRAYKTCRAVEAVVRNQLQRALPTALLVEIEDEITGLNGISIIDILDHCFDRRGHISDTLIADNNAKADEPFTRNEGMANYIRRIEQCQQLAVDAGIAWSDSQLVQRGQTAMGKCGLFRDEYKEWLRRPSGDKTWIDFKRYWQERYAEYEHLARLTAADGRFEANMSETQHGTDTVETDDNKVDEALDNLAYMMSSDKAQMEALATTNATLVTQVKELTATNARLAKEITTLTGIIATMAGGTAKATPAATAKKSEAGYDPNGYCWSHGYRVHYNHTSATCRSKKPGHKDEANRKNPMGGSESNKNWVKRE